MRRASSLLALFIAAGLSFGFSVSAYAQQQLRVGFIPVMGTAQIFVADGEG